MTSELLECIEISTAPSCQFAVIWLHGLGASGDDFEPIIPELQLDKEPGIRFVFPHAPVRPITINGGAPMRGWYDIDSLDFGQRKQDSEGIKESAALVNDLIEREVSKGILPEHIFLAGFSQGGAIALYTALTNHYNLAGILALSTYLPIEDETISQLTKHAGKMPIFMAHGEFDDVIQIRHAEHSKQVLENNGIVVQWHSYPMAHSVSADEIGHLSSWLKSQLRL